MIDLETIEYYQYMTDQEKEEAEDKKFQEIMDMYMVYESNKINEDMKNREPMSEEEAKEGFKKILDSIK